jgi:hypothetical protein
MKRKSKQLGADEVTGGLAKRISWQAAFIQAMKMELCDYEKVLDIYDDRRLTEEPLRIDCVVIVNRKNVKIKKNIASVFREHNLIEYKSPSDYVSVADFYKVYAYACLYVSLEEIPITSLTLTFVESRHPQKLISHLQKIRGYTVEENTEGIYTVKGDIIPMQIIDNRRLSAVENLWLKSLSNRLNCREVTRISEEITRQKKSADIAAYLYVIAKANHETLQEAIEMSDALTIEKVFENVGWTAKWEARGEAKGKTEGQDEKAREIARNFKKMGLSVSQIAEGTGLSLDTQKYQLPNSSCVVMRHCTLYVVVLRMKRISFVLVTVTHRGNYLFFISGFCCG